MPSRLQITLLALLILLNAGCGSGSAGPRTPVKPSESAVVDAAAAPPGAAAPVPSATAPAEGPVPGAAPALAAVTMPPADNVAPPVAADNREQPHALRKRIEASEAARRQIRDRDPGCVEARKRERQAEQVLRDLRRTAPGIAAQRQVRHEAESAYIEVRLQALLADPATKAFAEEFAGARAEKLRLDALIEHAEKAAADEDEAVRSANKSALADLRRKRDSAKARENDTANRWRKEEPRLVATIPAVKAALEVRVRADQELDRALLGLPEGLTAHERLMTAREEREALEKSLETSHPGYAEATRTIAELSVLLKAAEKR